MSSDGRQDERPSVLDTNIERLIAVAPEPARLSHDARERMASALRAHGADGETTLRSSAPRRLSRTAATIAAIAATIALVFIGQEFVSSGDGDRDVDIAVGGGDDAGTSSGTGTASDVEGPRGGAAGVDPGEGLDPIASGGAGDGSRVPVGPEGGGATGTGAASLGPGESDADRAGTVECQVTIDESVPAAAGTLIVWVKPMVDLPRVADPVAHRVAVGELEDTRTTSFSLADALGPARAMGAREVLVQVEAPGAAPARAIVAVDDAERGVTSFTLDAGVPVEGFVVDQRTGTPLAGAVVVVIDQLPMDGIPVVFESTEGAPEPVAVTDANGAFLLPHVVSAPTAQIRASHPGFAPQIETTRLADGAPVRIELVQGGAFVGTVEQDDGTRWANALVIASSMLSDPTLRVRPPMTFGMGITDASGQYRIADLPPGPYVVLLFGAPTSRADGPIGFTQAALSATEDVVVDFRARGSTLGDSLVGTLTDADGAALPGVTLTLMRVDEGVTSRNEWRATETAPDGTFTFTDVESGAHVLHRATESFRRMELVWIGDILGPTERTIALARTEWTVECQGAADARPRADAWVILEFFDPERSDWIFGGRGTTGKGGTITFENLPPGRYRAHVSSVTDGDGHVLASDVDVRTDAPTVTEVDVPAGGHLVVRGLERPGGAPLEGVIIRVRDAEGTIVPQPDSVGTGADGAARTLAVTFGPIEVLVEFPDGSERVVPLEFSDGGPGHAEPLEIVLEDR